MQFAPWDLHICSNKHPSKSTKSTLHAQHWHWTFHVWVPKHPHNISPTFISWKVNKMYVLTATVIRPVGPMGRVTFFKRSLVVLNVCRTTLSRLWFLRRLSPCGWIWFCATMHVILEESRGNPSFNLLTKLLCEYCGREHVWLEWKSVIPGYKVQLIHWIMGTNSSCSECLMYLK